MINVFIPHRWNNDDYSTISALLDRTKYKVRDYSVPASSPFDSIDRRYHVDPQIHAMQALSFARIVPQTIMECQSMKSNTLSLSGSP